MRPLREFGLIALLGSLLAPPVWTVDDPCGAEMSEMHEKSIAEIRRQNFHSNARSNKEAEQQMIAWLRKRHAEVERHEAAHAKGAGKWAGKMEYLFYQWRGKKYTIAGCR